MTFLLLLPAILALLTLGAHYFRYGLYPLTMLLVALLPLLLVRRRWVMRLVQVVLVVAAFEWFTVLRDIATERAMDGRDSRKSGFILGGTALFTLASAGLFETARLRRRYGRAAPPLTGSDSAPPNAAA